MSSSSSLRSPSSSSAAASSSGSTGSTQPRTNGPQQRIPHEEEEPGNEVEENDEAPQAPQQFWCGCAAYDEAGGEVLKRICNHPAFTEKAERNLHEKQHQDKVPPENVDMFMCGVDPNCARAYGQQNTRDRHEREGHKKAGFECTISGCGKRFKTDRARNEHVIWFHEERYKCKICGHKYPKPERLASHLETCSTRPITSKPQETTPTRAIPPALSLLSLSTVSSGTSSAASSKGSSPTASASSHRFAPPSPLSQQLASPGRSWPTDLGDSPLQDPATPSSVFGVGLIYTDDESRFQDDLLFEDGMSDRAIVAIDQPSSGPLSAFDQPTPVALPSWGSILPQLSSMPQSDSVTLAILRRIVEEYRLHSHKAQLDLLKHDAVGFVAKVWLRYSQQDVQNVEIGAALDETFLSLIELPTIAKPSSRLTAFTFLASVLVLLEYPDALPSGRLPGVEALENLKKTIRLTRKERTGSILEGRYVFDNFMELAMRFADEDGLFGTLDDDMERFLVVVGTQLMTIDSLRGSKSSLTISSHPFDVIKLLTRLGLLAEKHSLNAEAAKLSKWRCAKLDQVRSSNCLPIAKHAIGGWLAQERQGPILNAVQSVILSVLPEFVSPQCGLGLFGDVRDWIPMAQTLIDTTNYDGARTFCEKLERYRLDSNQDLVAAAHIKFVAAETRRMRRYMDLVNKVTSASGLVSEADRYYADGLRMLGSIPHDTVEMELIVASLMLGLGRLNMEEGMMEHASRYQKRAEVLRRKNLLSDDPLMVQAEYAGAEISVKHAEIHLQSGRRNEAMQKAQEAINTLAEVEPKWRLARKDAYVATLREKRAEALHVLYRAEVLRERNGEMESYDDQARKFVYLSQALNNITQCTATRLEIFGKDHMRYQRALRYKERLEKENREALLRLTILDD